MAFFDSLAWLVVGGVVGSSIGMGMAKLTSIILATQDKKKMIQVIGGKIPNNLKLDGETINVNQFKVKNNDGDIKDVEFGKPSKKTSSQGLDGVKIAFLQRMKNKFKKK
ncbi:hypothetical protein LCGC14_1482480 [marine sediment metagenome]|uniref:Uncharacterized protein n=1 Tax=marine sediment metagenome TaxID=412755 RepID=A0A0F9MB03_9ZZZZ